MKIIIILGLALVVGFGLCGCAAGKLGGTSTARGASGLRNTARDSMNASVKLLRITANVDGSGRFVFSEDSARYEHKNWSPPVDVTLDGESWSNLDSTPSGWRDFSKGLDLSRARVVDRQGRDVIALETTAQGFDLYFCDSPDGSADYAVTIAIPRRK